MSTDSIVFSLYYSWSSEDAGSNTPEACILSSGMTLLCFITSRGPILRVTFTPRRYIGCSFVTTVIVLSFIVTRAGSPAVEQESPVFSMSCYSIKVDSYAFVMFSIVMPILSARDASAHTDISVRFVS